MKVFLLDDHELLRDALRDSLEKDGIEVVGVASSAAEAWPWLVGCEVLLLDLGLPDMSGLEVIREVRRLFPAMAVLVLTMDEDARSARQALEAGALGYLVKSATRQELREALRAVHAGHLHVHARVAGVFGGVPPVTLKGRPLRVLQLLKEGLSNPEIASRLQVSRATVKADLQELYARFGVSDRTRLVVEALRARVLE